MTTLLAVLFAVIFQAPAATVTGVVMDAQDKHPVAGARVLLARADGPLVASVTVKTDEQGRFNATRVPAGTYQAIAVHDDYARGEAVARIQLTEGAHVDSVVILLVPTAVISGRVISEFGDPARRIFVRALVNSKVIAERRTDDLGAYRLFGLAAGAYVISAEPYIPPHVEGDRLVTPTPPCPDCRGEGAGVQQLNTLTIPGAFIDPRAVRPFQLTTAVYYPGVTKASDAQPVEVWPGARIENIDLRLVPSR